MEYQSSDYRYYQYYYYGDDVGTNSFKHRTHYRLKKVGFGLKDLEARFNSWWGKRGDKTKAPTDDLSTTTSVENTKKQEGGAKR